METLEHLEPRRSWDELLEHAHSRGESIRRRYEMVRLASVGLAVVITIVLPLSSALRADRSGGPEPVTRVTESPIPLPERIIEPMPLGPVLPGMASRFAPEPDTAPAGRSIPAIGRPPSLRIVQTLFVDRAHDVTNGAGLKTSDGRIDLLRGTATYTEETLTFAIQLADLSDPESPSVCGNYGMWFTFHEVPISWGVGRGARCSEYAMMMIDDMGSFKDVPFTGAWDLRTSTLTATVSLADLNRALPKRNGYGDPIPRIVPGDRFADITASTEGTKRTGTYFIMSGDPQSNFDDATG